MKTVFKNESQVLINEEVGKIRDQISSVTPTQACSESNVINIQHKFYLTMIDGKTFNTHCRFIVSVLWQLWCYTKSYE